MYNILLKEIGEILNKHNIEGIGIKLSLGYKNNLGYGKKLNELLNYNKINNPKETLYIGSAVRDFFSQNIKYKYYIQSNTELVFNEFYKYINNELSKKNKNLNTIIDDFYFVIKQSNIFDLGEEEIYKMAFYYIYKLFLYSSIVGINKEVEIINIISKGLIDNNLHNISIHDKISGYEDNIYCIDFSLKNNKEYILGFQVKPISFVHGLKSTTNYSYKKILSANTNNKNYLKGQEGIFIIYFGDNNNDLYFFNIENPGQEFPINTLFDSLSKYNK